MFQNENPTNGLHAKAEKINGVHWINKPCWLGIEKLKCWRFDWGYIQVFKFRYKVDGKYFNIIMSEIEIYRVDLKFTIAKTIVLAFVTVRSVKVQFYSDH